MLKAYHGTDCDIYAAESAEQAGKLCAEQIGEPCEDGYPRELTDAELDEQQPAFDEGESMINGAFTSIRQMLVEHGSKPGWLCGSVW